MLFWNYRAVTSVAAAVTLLSSSDRCLSAERGLSSYLPAYYGDYAVAVAPPSGLYGYATYYRYDGKLATSSASLDLNANALISGFQFVFPEKIEGVTLAAGAYSALIDASLKGSVSGTFGTSSIEQRKTQLGDTSISPAILYWSSGNWHFNIYEAVFLPTGRFELNDALNLSRNYYSFDTVAGITYRNSEAGFEVSLVPGLMYNLENSRTNYRTGLEFHFDTMLNFYVSRTFALGLHGYIYTQLADDEIDGAEVPSASSQSAAGGLSFLWVPAELGLTGKVVGKWLHDFEAQNRFRGEIFSLTAALKF